MRANCASDSYKYKAMTFGGSVVVVVVVGVSLLSSSF